MRIPFVIQALCCCICVLIVAACASSDDTPNPVSSQDQVIAKIVDDICDKNIALLGEGNFHRSGKTIAFKADLIERLISECKYEAVYFEASHYDFAALNIYKQQGKPVTQAMLSSAIGQLWNQDTAMQAFISVLYDQWNSGNLTLAGLDFQLGSRGAFYSLEQMPGELGEFLDDAHNARCTGLVKNFIWSSFPDQETYNQAVGVGIPNCLQLFENAIRANASLSESVRTHYLGLVRNISSVIAATSNKSQDYFSLRDRAMAQNFEHLYDNKKTIVWTANSHAAKSIRETKRVEGKTNLGALITETYQDNVFSLAFTAASGVYHLVNREPVDIASPPEGALEARINVLDNSALIYFTEAMLDEMGPVQSALFTDGFEKQHWSDYFDGVVLFARDHGQRGPTDALE